MIILLVSLIGSSIMGIPFLKIEVGPVSIFDLVIVATAFVYLHTFVRAIYGKVRVDHFFKSEKCLLAFFGVGFIALVLSLVGVYRIIVSGEVLFEKSYLFRQAYYLFFLPLILAVARLDTTYAVIDYLKQHYRQAFILIYTLSMVCRGSFSLTMTSTLCLGTILLLGRVRNKAFDAALLSLLLFTPVGVGGESTQLIIRISLLVFYFAKNTASVFKSGIYAMVLTIVGLLALAYIPLADIGLGGNTAWRAMYWQSQINQVISTFGIGVGYGNSYATASFASGDFTGIPFNPDSTYSRMEKIFVVGSHNSYVSVLYRLGVAGFASFLLYHVLIAFEVKSTFKNDWSYAYYAFFSSIIILAFNVGLESPMNLLTFVFAGSLMSMVFQKEDLESILSESACHQIKCGKKVFLGNKTFCLRVKRSENESRTRRESPDPKKWTLSSMVHTKGVA